MTQQRRCTGKKAANDLSIRSPTMNKSPPSSVHSTRGILSVGCTWNVILSTENPARTLGGKLKDNDHLVLIRLLFLFLETESTRREKTWISKYLERSELCDDEHNTLETLLGGICWKKENWLTGKSRRCLQIFHAITTIVERVEETKTKDESRPRLKQ